MLTASTSSPSHSVGTSYDALGRVLTQVGPQGTASFSYDEAGRRTTLSYPGSGPVIGYSYNAASQLIAISRDPAGTPVQLAAYAYDDHGRRTLLTRGNGATTAYDYDDVSRLSQMVHDADDTTYDLTLDYGYNPASQIVSTVRSNDVYAWGRHYAVTRSYTANGRNEYSAVGGNSPAYDGNRNMTSSGASGTPTYGYTSENMLTSATGGVTLTYDPTLRLYETVGGGTTTRMAYDGGNAIAEYSGSNAVQRRYVFGPGGEPLVRFEGSGTSTPVYYHADERGSVIALSDDDGDVTNVNAYDEYGIPAAGNAGRFQYTGQQWLAELDMYHYRARIYSPTLGRFLQTDPIGYAGGMNLYTYVGNDPVNQTDPSGLQCNGCDIPVTGRRDPRCDDEGALWDDKCFSPVQWTPDIVDVGIGSSGSGTDVPFEGQCVFRGSGIRVSWRGYQVSISGKIQFFDAPGGWANYDRSDIPWPDSDLYLGMINEDWTLDVGPWSVSTRLTMEPGGLSAFVGAGSGMASPGHRWMWLPATSPGAVHFFYNRRVIRGEFGHHLGLDHQADEAANRGIMQRNHQGDILPEHIETIIRDCPALSAPG